MHIAASDTYDGSKTLRLEKAYSKASLHLIPFLFFCYLLAYFARINVSFAKLEMLTDLQMSETAYGLGAGIFFIGYLCFAVPSNMALERIGAKRWIAILMVAWGLITSAMMFTNNVTTFYTLRFLVGVAEAGFFPGIIFYFTTWFPEQRRGRVIAWFMTACALSGVIGGPLSGWIMKSFSHAPMGVASWQWLFLLYGIPTILTGALVYFWLPNSSDDARFLTAEERALIKEDVARDNPAGGGKKSPVTFKFLASPVVWYFAAIYFLIEMGEYALGFWMPSIIRSTGYTDVQSIGFLTAVPYLVSTVFMVWVGRSADLRNERRWHLAAPMLMGMLGLMLAAHFDSSPAIAITGLTLATCGIMAAFPIFWTVPTPLLGAYAAAGIALINSVGNLAGFVSPTLVGWIYDTTKSTDISLHVIAGCTFLGAIMFLKIPKSFSAKKP